ncbi:hypothetical protein PsYK624_083540 [Phanerochaete sordida]|uniref:Uncharacterized protein n=1 Tax=Phanerochaete sordida TaxID=48140 RepID=A0A9P3LE67_9APHY|nr:hypothetical protein PsYK624_083540 [Phanerochaete sordida]
MSREAISVPLELFTVEKQLLWILTHRDVQPADLSAQYMKDPKTLKLTGYTCRVCNNLVKKPKKVMQSMYAHNRTKGHLNRVAQRHCIVRTTLGDRRAATMPALTSAPLLRAEELPMLSPSPENELSLRGVNLFERNILLADSGAAPRTAGGDTVLSTPLWNAPSTALDDMLACLGYPPFDPESGWTPSHGPVDTDMSPFSSDLEEPSPYERVGIAEPTLEELEALQFETSGSWHAQPKLPRNLYVELLERVRLQQECDRMMEAYITFPTD